MLTVLGITVVFSLNLRSSSAYERYSEGRRCWSQLNACSTSLARNVWLFAEEQDGEAGKEDLLAKITFLNMIVAFAVALKHRLRFEPYIQYDDLYELVSHLDTFAKYAGAPTVQEGKASVLRKLGNLLHVAEPNPRAELKKAKRPVGNLPLEILFYMGSYLKEITDNGTLRVSALESKALNDLRIFDDILTTSDRILNTHMPLAYTIAIAQITWIYVLAMPVQLVHLMGWCVAFGYNLLYFQEANLFEPQDHYISDYRRRIHYSWLCCHRERDREPIRKRGQRLTARVILLADCFRHQHHCFQTTGEAEKLSHTSRQQTAVPYQFK